jgi:hypothetical protein
MIDEKDIVDKALGKHTKGCTLKLPFINIEHLIEDIQIAFPIVNEVFVYNHDQRDSKDGPTLTTRNLRPLKAVITKTVSRHYEEITGFDCNWRAVFVAVEDGFAYLKVTAVKVKEVT